MFGLKNLATRLEATEAVLKETRLTLDGTFQALAGVLSHIPEIAHDLRVAAGFTLDAPISEPDPNTRARIAASRRDITDILNAMADTVDRNCEMASRLHVDAGGGQQ